MKTFQDILIVDDEEQARNLMRKFVMNIGYSVDMAGSGEEAIEKIAENRYGVILLDIKMPGMGGFAALKRFKEMAPDTEVVMVTGAFVGAQDAAQAFKDKACDYIVKTIDRNWREFFLAIVHRAYHRYKINVLNTSLLLSIEAVAQQADTSGQSLQKILDSFNQLTRDTWKTVLLLASNKACIAFVNESVSNQTIQSRNISEQEKILFSEYSKKFKEKGWAADFISPNDQGNDPIINAIFPGDSMPKGISCVVLPAVCKEELCGLLVMYIHADEHNCRSMFEGIDPSLQILGSLCHMLQLMEERLQSMEEKLQLTEEKSLLALNFHHSLSQLMGPLSQALTEKKNDKAQNLVEKIQLRLRQMREYIRAQGQMESTKYLLGAILDDALGCVVGLMWDESVKVDNSLRGSDITIQGDEALLQIAFLSLLENSHQSIIEKLKKGDSPDYKGRIAISHRELEGKIELVIEDNGHGVEQPERLFHMFTTKKEGLGIGLYNARIIFRRHGGELRYDETFNNGARFIAVLPRLAAEEYPAADSVIKK